MQLSFYVYLACMLHEQVPCRWSNLSSTGRLSWSWFGRLGAGDILARFKWGKLPSAY